MALARYKDSFWFPNGILAANTPARIFPESSSALAAIFTNASGSTPLPNPLRTNALGVLEFWAEAGNYWIHIDTETFHVSIGMSEEESDLSTGIASGGRVTPSLSSPTAVDIAAVDGYIVNFTSEDQSKPTVQRIKRPDQTVELDAAGLLRTVTWWLLDSGGNVVQTGTPPSNATRRNFIVLGLTSFLGGAIDTATSQADILKSPVNQLGDLMSALGPFSRTGNRVTPNGVNRKFNQSAGTLFVRAFNRFDSMGNPTQDPHISTTLAQSPASFRYITSTGTTFGPLITDIDAANFDSGGVITPIGGGSNTSSVHRVFIFSTGVASSQIAIQYGQSTFSNLSNAINSLGSGNYVVNPLLTDGTLIAWIVATRIATNLSDPAQAVFVSPGKFDTP